MITNVRWFAIMAVIYGIVGMLVGVIVAAHWPSLNLILGYLGCHLGVCVRYTQCGDFRIWWLRCLQHPFMVPTYQPCALFGGRLAFSFLDFNLVIVRTVITYPLGINKNMLSGMAFGYFA